MSRVIRSPWSGWDSPAPPVSSQVGDTLVVASSRDELMRGLRRIQVGRRPGERIVVQPMTARLGHPAPNQTQLDSGLIFDLDPAELTVGKSGSLELRRGVELLRGLGCRRLRGTLALKGDRLGLELTTSLDRAARPARADGAAATIDPAWLEGIPSAGVMGVISLALDPSAAFWDSAFSLADRLERVDPVRAEVAPLRARINLLAASAGVRPEADLWPHLRGVTASLIGDPSQPGRPTGLLLVLACGHRFERRTARQRVSSSLGGPVARWQIAARDGLSTPRPPRRPQRPNRDESERWAGVPHWSGVVTETSWSPGATMIGRLPPGTQEARTVDRRSLQGLGAGGQGIASARRGGLAGALLAFVSRSGCRDPGTSRSG